MEICIFFTVMIAGEPLPVPVMKHGLRGGEGKEEGGGSSLWFCESERNGCIKRED